MHAREAGSGARRAESACGAARRGAARRGAAREEDLLRANGRRWANIPAATSEVFVRGFVHRVSIPLPTLVNEGAELFERSPLVQEIAVQGMEGSVSMYSAPTADEMWSVTSAQLAQALTKFPPGRVRLLSVAPVIYVEGDWSTPPGPPSGYASELTGLVAAAPELAALDGLEILHGEAGREAFLRLPRLERVRVYRAAISAAELARMLPRLTELRFEDAVEDADLALLARVPVRLRHLGLTLPRLSGVGFEELVASEALADLQSLDLSGMRIDERALTELPRAPFASRLRDVRLHLDFDLTIERAEAMFPAIETIRVTRTRSVDQKRPA